jgi:hypothetical protein
MRLDPREETVMNTAIRDYPALRLMRWAAWLAGLGVAIGIAACPGAAAASTGQATTAAPRYPARMAPVTHMVIVRARPASAPRRYRIVGGEFTSANNGETGAVIDCPTGTVVLSGGVVQSSKRLGVTVNSSYPVNGDAGWFVLVNNTSGQDVSAEIQAICAKKPRDYTIVQSGYFDNPAGAQTGAIYAACPAGTKVLGGGGFMSNGLTSVNLNSSWPEERFLYPPTYWWVLTVNNASASDNLVFAFAVCGKEPGYYLAQGTNVSNPAGAQSFASVTCPPPTTVLGGGIYSSSASTAVNIDSTYVAANGWNAWENNASTSNAIIFPVAICAT